jgi:hypothetical protein
VVQVRAEKRIGRTEGMKEVDEMKIKSSLYTLFGIRETLHHEMSDNFADPRN